MVPLSAMIDGGRTSDQRDAICHAASRGRLLERLDSLPGYSRTSSAVGNVPPSISSLIPQNNERSRRFFWCRKWRRRSGSVSVALMGGREAGGKREEEGQTDR